MIILASSCRNRPRSRRYIYIIFSTIYFSSFIIFVLPLHSISLYMCILLSFNSRYVEDHKKQLTHHMFSWVFQTNAIYVTNNLKIFAFTRIFFLFYVQINKTMLVYRVFLSISDVLRLIFRNLERNPPSFFENYCSCLFW